MRSRLRAREKSRFPLDGRRESIRRESVRTHSVIFGDPSPLSGGISRPRAVHDNATWCKIPFYGDVVLSSRAYRRPPAGGGELCAELARARASWSSRSRCHGDSGVKFIESPPPCRGRNVDVRHSRWWRGATSACRVPVRANPLDSASVVNGIRSRAGLTAILHSTYYR